MYAKFAFVFLLTVTVCHSQVTENIEETDEVDEVDEADEADEAVVDLPELPKPRLTYITTFSPAGFTVQWAPVESDPKNPVNGFKVHVWENEKEVLYAPEDIEGLGKVWIKEYRVKEKPLDEVPTTDPLVQTVGANETMARFEKVKLNEPYQIRVRAINDVGEEGPYSDVLGLKIGDE